MTAFALAASAGFGAFGTDVGPPMPRISSAPPRTTTARSTTFNVDSARGTSLECALDRSELRLCLSPISYRGLGVGDHRFRVRVRDATGASSGTVVYQWRVVARRVGNPPGRATTLARPVMMTMPVPPYLSPNATFGWRAQAGRRWPAGTTFVCALDGHGWTRCRTPKTYRGLRAGAHVFRVRAKLRDRVSRTNRFGWTIELAMPALPTITSQPPPPTASTTAWFTFEAEGAAGFECRLDKAAWEPCASPVTYVGLAPGTHEFCVRAVSADGTPGLAACTTWMQDPVAPPPPPPSAPPPSAPPGPDLFTITGDLPTLLSPGIGGQLPLTVSNPSDFDLQVSRLIVSVQQGSSRPACDGPANLQVTQSNTASGAVSILVPAHGSVTLPAQGATAPELTMLDLAINQDPCKGAVFTLVFSGHGTRLSG